MPVVIKIRVQATGDVLRMPMPEWPDLQSVHARLVALPGINLPGWYALKYIDPDGDAVSILTDDDLQEAISMIGGSSSATWWRWCSS